MPIDPPQEPPCEDEPPREPPPNDRPAEPPPPPPDDPLRRAQSFAAERLAPLRPKGAAAEADEYETPAEHLQQLMDEYRRRQLAQAPPAPLAAADPVQPSSPEAPDETGDQEEEP